MIETRGREVRISHLADPSGTLKIRNGSTVNMFGGEFHVPSDANNLRIDNAEIQRFLKPNDVIYFDDGKVVGIVVEISNTGAKMEIKIGGKLKGNCAVRFTGGKHNNLQLMQKKDIEDISAISQLTIIDYLAIPYISGGADPITIKELLGENGKTIKIVSKIDTLEGVQQYENIL
jgi:pyruvate kinase